MTDGIDAALPFPTEAARCTVREPSAWALQVQLEKEEHRVGELEDENRALKARVAQLEAERYQTVSIPPTLQVQRMFAPMNAFADSMRRFGSALGDAPRSMLERDGYPFLPQTIEAARAPSPAAPPAAAEPPSTPPIPTRWELLEVD